MGEYFAMLVFGSVFATVFLGGYNLLPINWVALADKMPSIAALASTKSVKWLSG